MAAGCRSDKRQPAGPVSFSNQQTKMLTNTGSHLFKIFQTDLGSKFISGEEPGPNVSRETLQAQKPKINPMTGRVITDRIVDRATPLEADVLSPPYSCAMITLVVANGTLITT